MPRVLRVSIASSKWTISGPDHTREHVEQIKSIVERLREA